MSAQTTEAEYPYIDPLSRIDIFPRGLNLGTDTNNNQVTLAGVPLASLTRQYGTPLYLIDLGEFTARAQAWAEAMATSFNPERGLAGGMAYFAGKTLMTARLVKIATAAGMGIDSASEGELRTALAAGADPAHVGLHGNNKSDTEIELALTGGDLAKTGIGRLIVDSLAEIERIEAAAVRTGTRPGVMVRVTTGVHAGGHDFIATAHEDQKFGLSLLNGSALSAVERINSSEHLDFLGLHSHIGSQIYDLGAFDAALRVMAGFISELRAKAIPVRELDLGGGYPVAYTPNDEKAPEPAEIASHLAEIVRETIAEPPFVSIEPGRSVIGPAGITLYRVGTIKNIPLDEGERRYVSVDGGMSDNIRPALYGSRYCAIALDSQARHILPVTETDTLPTRVVGKHCESGDIIISDTRLPATLTGGDLLLTPVTGAYGRVMGSNYNMLPTPAVIGVQDGQIVPLLRGVSVADLLARDYELN
ncbi:MAG: diaminopimelate decarboxylase [Varibaculum sp.]|nr:diaminopimelate decarboxylase [Varibaculum sp.]